MYKRKTMSFNDCGFFVKGAEKSLIPLWLEVSRMFSLANAQESWNNILFAAPLDCGFYRVYFIDSNDECATINEHLEFKLKSVWDAVKVFNRINDGDAWVQFAEIHQRWFNYVLRLSFSNRQVQSKFRSMPQTKSDFAIVSIDNDSDGLGSPIGIIWKSPDCSRFKFNEKTGFYSHVPRRSQLKQTNSKRRTK